jgi:hypothetical protein
MSLKCRDVATSAVMPNGDAPSHTSDTGMERGDGALPQALPPRDAEIDDSTSTAPVHDHLHSDGLDAAPQPSCAKGAALPGDASSPPEASATSFNRPMTTHKLSSTEHRRLSIRGHEH